MDIIFYPVSKGQINANYDCTNSFLLFGVLTSVPILVKIDQEMRL